MCVVNFKFLVGSHQTVISESSGSYQLVIRKSSEIQNVERKYIFGFAKFTPAGFSVFSKKSEYNARHAKL